jgi:hypothetical protein
VVGRGNHHRVDAFFGFEHLPKVTVSDGFGIAGENGRRIPVIHVTKGKDIYALLAGAALKKRLAYAADADAGYVERAAGRNMTPTAQHTPRDDCKYSGSGCPAASAASCRLSHKCPSRDFFIYTERFLVMIHNNGPLHNFRCTAIICLVFAGSQSYVFRRRLLTAIEHAQSIAVGLVVDNRAWLWIIVHCKVKVIAGLLKRFCESIFTLYSGGDK